MVSLGCLWSPRAKAISVPTEASPSIFGDVVEAATPSGMSAEVMKPLSLVSSDVFFGVVTLTVTLSPEASAVTVTSPPPAISRVSILASASMVVVPTFTLPKAFWFTSAPDAMLPSFVFSACVKALLVVPSLISSRL